MRNLLLLSVWIQCAYGGDLVGASDFSSAWFAFSTKERVSIKCDRRALSAVGRRLLKSDSISLSRFRSKRGPVRLRCGVAMMGTPGGNGLEFFVRQI